MRDADADNDTNDCVDTDVGIVAATTAVTVVVVVDDDEDDDDGSRGAYRGAARLINVADLRLRTSMRPSSSDQLWLIDALAPPTATPPPSTALLCTPPLALLAPATPAAAPLVTPDDGGQSAVQATAGRTQCAP